MEFMPDTLSKLVKGLAKQKKTLPEYHIKLYSYQMFRGLAYLHACGFCHRDIKPQNMLIDPNYQILKLCDFGSAKKLIKGDFFVCDSIEILYRRAEYFVYMFKVLSSSGIDFRSD